MPSYSPPWLKRFTPIRGLLEDRGELTENEPFIEEKTLLVPNEADLIFGNINADTSVRLRFEYESADDDQMLIGVMIHYDGDAGAFQLTGNEFTMTFAAPWPLANGTQISWVVPPQSYGETNDLIFTALAADDGVEKTGTLTVCDRVDFSDDASPVRILKVITMSNHQGLNEGNSSPEMSTSVAPDARARRSFSTMTSTSLTYRRASVVPTF
jgi:hypothetical protein